MPAPAHFKIAGIPVHVQPVFFVISGLWGLRYIDLGLDIVLIWVAASFVSILVHELGHGFALKAFGQTSAIVLHGFGGVTISQGRRQMGRARGVFVSLAGSFTALTVLWLPTRALMGNTQWFFQQGTTIRAAVVFLAFQNLWWSVANLLPIRPLDGGNVTAELFGLPLARRISIGTAIAGGIWAVTHDQTYAAFFALFLAFNNWQEIRAEQAGSNVDVFEVEAPDAGSGKRRRRPGGAPLRSVPGPVQSPAGPPTLTADDPARAQQMAWNALRQGDAAGAHRLVERVGPTVVSPYLRAATALATGEAGAFELFEEAYAAQPGGPPNLVATDLLARSGAATAVARRLLARSDGSGREGAATLQTHLHYGDHYQAAAEVGEAVYEGAPPSPAQTAFEVACSWARAGEVERAVDWLGQAADQGFRAATIVDGEPDLAPVRDDPRWPLLRARLL